MPLEAGNLALYLISALLLALIALLYRLGTRQSLVLARLEAMERAAGAVERAVEEARYDIPPARRAAIEGSIIAVVRGGVEAGVAFFISPTRALTVAHNLRTSSGRHQRAASCVRCSDGARLSFDVAHCNAALDFAVLELRQGQPTSQHFLTVPREAGVSASERGVFLVTCNIRMAAEAPDVASLGVAWHHARVVKQHARSFLYDSVAFDGDTGGAIVVARTGAVIGLHKELVSAARELIEHKGGVGDRLNAEELSLQSLIRGTSVGCVAVRTDSEDVQRALVGR
jgi:hypothetical protein